MRLGEEGWCHLRADHEADDGDEHEAQFLRKTVACGQAFGQGGGDDGRDGQRTEHEGQGQADGLARKAGEGGEYQQQEGGRVDRHGACSSTGRGQGQGALR